MFNMLPRHYNKCRRDMAYILSSDRQAGSQNSQVIENKEVTENAKMGLPPSYLSDPELVMIIEKWPEIPLFIKQAILKLIS